MPHVLSTSACGCSWKGAALMSSKDSWKTAALMRSCRLVLEMMILTLWRDAVSMTTAIATCGPFAPCLISSNLYQLVPLLRKSDVWTLLKLGLSSALSIDGVNCSHAVLSSTDAALTSSVVTQLTRVLLTWNRRKHTGRLDTTRFFQLSCPSCSVVSSSLAADDTIRCWAVANACSAEPCRFLAFTASSESQCASGHCLSCHEPSRSEHVQTVDV